MPLDPLFQPILDQLRATPTLDNEGLTIAELRARANVGIAALTAAGRPGPELREVRDRTVPGPNGEVPVRIYRPSSNDSLPVYVYLHGGAWWLGDLEMNDASCRATAADVGCVVVSVDYRLAPEHPFPIPAEDCFAVTQWVAAHAAELRVDANRLAVGGSSAGANLAAAVALMARDRGGPRIVFQVLEIPGLDPRMTTSSMKDFAEGYLLTRDAIEQGWRYYLGDPESAANPYAAPARAEDLAHLPPALVVTAEFDPLRDEGEEYGRRLQQADVPTVISRYDGMIHGFAHFTAMVAEALDCQAEVAEALRGAFGQKSADQI